MINLGNGKYRPLEEINSALKLKELVKKEAHKQVGTPWGFKLQFLLEKST